MEKSSNQTIIQKTVKSGVTFGSALAMVISYTAWKSIGWAILHHPVLNPVTRSRFSCERETARNTGLPGRTGIVSFTADRIPAADSVSQRRWPYPQAW